MPWGNDGPVTLPERLARQVRTELAAQADPVRAEGEKRYLKSEIEHFGVPVPAVRKSVTAVRKGHPGLTRDDVADLARRLWDEPVHERRMAAALLLRAYVDRLSATGHPEVAAVYRRWGSDDDMWVRRSGLLGFVRKAIGWVLREVGKRQPDDVFAWLAPRVAVVSRVTLREAVKYLSPDQREELMGAYRAR